MALTNLFLIVPHVEFLVCPEVEIPDISITFLYLPYNACGNETYTRTVHTRRLLF